MSSRLGYQVLALNPGQSKKFGTNRQTDRNTDSTVYRVALQLNRKEKEDEENSHKLMKLTRYDTLRDQIHILLFFKVIKQK